MNKPAVMIMTAVADRTAAEALADALLESRAAACVQELPVLSHYRWKGQRHGDAEILLLIKTAEDRADAAVAVVKANHPYELPEILVAPILGGLDAYLQWVWDETRPEGPGAEAPGAGAAGARQG